MELSRKQCTCTDLSCPFHPTNHDKGCTLCIAKNLKEKEIPSCFFNQRVPDVGHGYSQEEYARIVNETKE